MADYDYSAEEWREIPGHEKYEVSSFGRVRTKPKILKPWVNHATGYAYIALGRGYKGTVHRLVCLVFHGRAESAEQRLVAHGDGDRSNNHANNLRWATHADNCQDAIRHGTTPLIQYRQGSLARARHNMAKLSEDDVAEIKRLAATDIERQELASRFRISRNQLWRILTGKNWRDCD